MMPVIMERQDAVSARLPLHSSRVAVTGLFLVMAAVYVATVFLPDPSLLWAAADETCCHVPAIRAIQQEGVADAVSDYRRYRTATTPLYHMLMSAVIDRLDPLVLRLAWVAIALAVGIVLYRYVRADAELRNGERAALALSAAFLLSPTVRASAVYFITDGLAVHLAIAALVLLRRAQTNRDSPRFAVIAILVAFASFYTRQYYLWVALFVTYGVISTATSRRAKLAAVAGCVLLSLPALALFSVWKGFTPPLGTPVHTQPMLLSTAPNVLGLLALYSLPLVCIAVRDGVHEVKRGDMPWWLPLCILGGIGFYMALGTAVGLVIPESGGVLSPLRLLGETGTALFLGMSAIGLVMLIRWLVVNGASQLWWGVFLVPLLLGSIVLQRYFEPAILAVMFLALRPRDALKALDSRMVWYYPAFTALYAVSRMIYFA